jgi:aspartate aminotransferase
MDLNLEQWQVVADIAKERGFTLLVDAAYQGFGQGLEEDVAGIRLLADQVDEMIVCSSCSKNFGLYRERIGAISLVGKDSTKSEIAFSNILSVVRAIYSMPPAHGADIVATILGSQELTSLWHQELEEKRNRINGLRSFIAKKFAEKGVPGNFDFIAKQNGMFSFLGIDKDAINTLKNDYSIYIVGSSRVNVAGVNEANADYLAESLATVLTK